MRGIGNRHLEGIETIKPSARNKGSPVYGQTGLAAGASENTAFTEGPYPTIATQAWGSAPLYPASWKASNQEVADAFVQTNADEQQGWYPKVPNASDGLDLWVAYNLGEALGRKLASVAQSAVYSALTAQGTTTGAGQSGGYFQLGTATAITVNGAATTELAQGTIALDTASQMLACLDSEYLESEKTKWYMSGTAWSGLTRQQDAQKHALLLPNGSRELFGIPVQITSQTVTPAASTVSGVLLGDLSRAFTLRIATGPASTSSRSPLSGTQSTPRRTTPRPCGRTSCRGTSAPW